MRRWLLPGLMVVLAAASALVATTQTPPPSPAAPTSRAATALLSARRAPDLLRGAVGEARLSRDLRGLLGAGDLGGARRASCLIVQEGDRVLFAERPGLSLLPASNLKILTASAVLAAIGPEARLRTSVRGPAPVAGVVEGSLWLVGGGDPLLETADYAASFKNQPQVYNPFEKLADAVVAAGVRQVRGGIVGDESRYDGQRYLPSWRPIYITDNEVGPMSALAVNDGFVAFEPRLVPAGSPPAAAAALLASLLEQRGVMIGSAPAAGVAPPTVAEIAGLDSLPAKELVAQMLRESDNYTAELLVKELGFRATGRGSTATGTAAVVKALQDQGLRTDGVTAVDGSGLDRGDRATCSAVMGAFQPQGPAGPLVQGFAVAGKSGTLARRFTGALAGRVRAKTGSLDSVTALSGWLDRPGGNLAFSLIANELPDRSRRGLRLQDDVAAALARYPDAPGADQLRPRA